MSMPARAGSRLVAALALLALTSGVAACSTEKGGGSSDTTVTVAVNGGTAMKAAVGEFEKAHPDIKVRLADSPDNYTQVVATQLTGGTAPDVIQVFPGTGNNLTVKLAGAKGQFADLSGQPWAASVPKQVRGLLTTDDGKLVAVPMTFSSIGGIYNQAALDALKLTIPKTWTQVLQFCRSAKAGGKVAFGAGFSDTWTTQLIPYAHTATLVYGPDPTFTEKQIAGTTTFAASGWRTAFDKYLEMNAAGCFNASPNGTAYARVQDAVRQGQTLAVVSVAAETAAIKTGGPADLKLTYAAFPATDNESDTVLSATTGIAFAVNAKSKQLDAARTFVAWLADPKTQIAYADAYGDSAAMPGQLSQTSQVSQVVKQYVTASKIAPWPDQSWPSTKVQPEVLGGVQALFSGQNNVNGVLKKMDDAFKDR